MIIAAKALAVTVVLFIALGVVLVTLMFLFARVRGWRR